MAKCKSLKADGTPCKNNATKDSEYCWFHSPGVKDKRNVIDLSNASVYRRTGGSYSYEKLFGKKIGETPRVEKLEKFEKFYKDGGLVARAIDSYVHVAIANGYQIIDSETGERETENTKIIEELDQRINFHENFEKVFRSLSIYGFVWGEMVLNGKKIKKLNHLPPQEIDIIRDKKTGDIKEIKQIRAGKEEGKWSGDKLKNIFFHNANIMHSETYGTGFLERIYTEAKERKEMGEDLNAVTKFIAYPMRVAKVGSDNYPASEAAVTKVADQVDDLEPGDWMITRHNLEFEFHSPESPEAMVESYKEKTIQLIVAMGVPSLYTALSNIDAQTLKEIRNIFNSTVRSMQNTVARQFEEQIINRQFELLDKIKKRTDIVPVKIIWNPLTVSVLSILELTQLVQAGVIGSSEARRILESMGYGLLRGEKYLEEILAIRKALAPKAPKETHPTEDEPDKPPNETRQPQKDGEPIRTKEPSELPKIQRPQPNAPTYEQWLQMIKALSEIDPYSAKVLLEIEILNGFEQNI